MIICRKCNKETDGYTGYLPNNDSEIIIGFCCRKDFEKRLDQFVYDYIQPKRSKREDLDCCERVKWLEQRIANSIEDKPYFTLDEELLKLSKMRCSEHKG